MMLLMYIPNSILAIKNLFNNLKSERQNFVLTYSYLFIREVENFFCSFVLLLFMSCLMTALICSPTRVFLSYY